MNASPDLMPVLSTGKHRNPRKGACFMEMASFLAGERWSDHPACTHPLLAAAAREVNDRVTNGARTRIAPLIPDVVGLVHDDPRAHVWIARESALAAIAIASEPRQRVLAVGLLSCERVLARLEGRPEHLVSARVQEALNDVPLAYAWATGTFGIGHGTLRSFVRCGAPTIVHAAVAGIAEATVPDHDDRLVALLERLVVLCRTWFEAPAETPAMRLPDSPAVLAR